MTNNTTVNTNLKTPRKKDRKNKHPHPKYDYKSKLKKKPSIEATVEWVKNNAKSSHNNKTIIEPTQKYIDTVNFIKKKKFFVDAEYGTRVYFDNIIEFRVDGKDIPVFVAKVKYKDKKGNIQDRVKVYRIIRYNENQIVGMPTQNHNYCVLKSVNISV